MAASVIILTGGNGFLGKAVQQALEEHGMAFTCVPRGAYWEADRLDADGVIHLAGLCGGIQDNIKRPAEFLRDNIQVGMSALEMAREFKIGRFLNVSSACAYPEFVTVNNFKLRPEHMWDGRPQTTHAPYGIAKRCVMEMVDAYRKQYGLDGFSVVLANLYGVGVEYNAGRSHVIPALVKKMWDAKEAGRKHVVCLGSGKPAREFLYVDDAARAIVKLYKEYKDGGSVNVGSGDVYSISYVAEAIREAVGFEGELVWDESYPDGNTYREVDSTPIKDMGWVPEVSFKEGIKRVVADFLKARLAVA